MSGLPKITFIYESFVGVHSETELAQLAENLDELRAAFNTTGETRSIDLHGGVSWIVDGVELLGRECWTEDVRLLSLGVGVESFTGQRFSLTATPNATHSESVDVRLLDRGSQRFERTLDQISYETAWQLMRARAERVRQALGDPEGTRWLADWRSGWPAAGHHVLVEESLRQHVCEADLVELLAPAE